MQLEGGREGGREGEREGERKRAREGETVTLRQRDREIKTEAETE